MLTTNFSDGGSRVTRIGLCCMGTSRISGAADNAESIATIHRALDLTLTVAERERLDAALPAGAGAGEHNQPVQLAKVKR